MTNFKILERLFLNVRLKCAMLKKLEKGHTRHTRRRHKVLCAQENLILVKNINKPSATLKRRNNSKRPKLCTPQFYKPSCILMVSCCTKSKYIYKWNTHSRAHKFVKGFGTADFNDSDCWKEPKETKLRLRLFQVNQILWVQRWLIQGMKHRCRQFCPIAI